MFQASYYAIILSRYIMLNNSKTASLNYESGVYINIFKKVIRLTVCITGGFRMEKKKLYCLQDALFKRYTKKKKICRSSSVFNKLKTSESK